MKNTTIKIFKNVSMIYQHDGLAKLAASKKVKLDGLEPGEHILFVNGARDRIKMYSANKVLSYYRAEKNTRINLEMIEYIPQCFGAKGMDWEAANKMAVAKMLATQEKKRPVGLLE